MRCWYGKTCESPGDVSTRRHGHGASRCQHAGLVWTVCLRGSVFMFLIQITAEELAAPRTHCCKANSPCEFAATPERVKDVVSLSPPAAFLRNQIEREFAIARARNRLAKALFVRCEDFDAFSPSRNGDVPLLRIRGGAHAGIRKQDVIDCLTLRTVRRDCVPALKLPIMWRQNSAVFEANGAGC